jgi:hypothetical protein
VCISLSLSLSHSSGDWIRDLSTEGVEPNPGPFDSEETKSVEVYSPDGSAHLQSFKAPQKNAATVIHNLRGLGKLAAHPPPAGHDWTTLVDAEGIATTWDDQVDAGKYKITATLATPGFSSPAGQRTRNSEQMTERTAQLTLSLSLSSSSSSLSLPLSLTLSHSLSLSLSVLSLCLFLCVCLCACICVCVCSCDVLYLPSRRVQR